LPARFDVVHLGVGEDGHTASWPPGNHDVLVSDRLVEVVPPFNGRSRMTLTPRAVNAARSRIVLATGAAKRPVIARWVHGDRSLPIATVRRVGTTVFLDPAAAPRE
jgi:6-phosphogluconolactonase/glucosamine-6-phosphate isomerase/deaminase